MADKKISDLTAASSIAANDLLLIENAGGNSRKVTGANAALSLQNIAFRGARVRMNADDTGQNVTTETAITFDVADFDTDSFFSGGAPTRLTIGSDIEYVSLVGQVSVSSSTADTWYQVTITHFNSSNTALRLFRNAGIEGGATGRTMSIASGPVAVASGDYFTLGVREESDNSVTIEGDQTVETFLALHVLA